MIRQASGRTAKLGAQLGYCIGWTMFLTFPLMASVQEISARIGRTAGHGIGRICAAVDILASLARVP